MLISDYFREIKQLINSSKIIAESHTDFMEFDKAEGMTRGRLLFINGHVLEFMEYVIVGRPKPKYRYQLADKNGTLIFRYDNAPHHPEIATYPHHKHTPEGLSQSSEVKIAEVLKEIEKLVLK